jgi:hypothetical protein
MLTILKVETFVAIGQINNITKNEPQSELTLESD